MHFLVEIGAACQAADTPACLSMSAEGILLGIWAFLTLGLLQTEYMRESAGSARGVQSTLGIQSYEHLVACTAAL
jgi:hypothetical protein